MKHSEFIESIDIQFKRLLRKRGVEDLSKRELKIYLSMHYVLIKKMKKNIKNKYCI